MKKVCVVTSTRADYGLLYWIMKEIEAITDLELCLMVTGMHLSPKFGNTWEVIVRDGFEIAEKIDLGNLDDSRLSMIHQVADGLKSFADAFIKHQPDMVVILGDRYEMLAVAQAAFFLSIPIAHIHGGEVTEGALDDGIRHAITKLSTLHFTAAEEYRQRVIRMGANPEHVFNVGAPGLENFLRLKLLTKSELEQSLNFRLRDKNILVTYHPVTAVDENEIDDLIKALSHFDDVGQIITMPNSDPGHDEIFEKWHQYAKGRENVVIVTSLGQIRYMSAMKICDAVVGNSSSGIIEAPFCGTPTVNIGERQKGRLMADTVLTLRNIDSAIILDAIRNAISMHKNPQLIFGNGQSANKIVSILSGIFRSFPLDLSFYDLSDGAINE